jgi:hypothetical protein
MQSKVKGQKKTKKGMQLMILYMECESCMQNTLWITSSVDFGGVERVVRSVLDRHMGGVNFCNRAAKDSDCMALVIVHIDATAGERRGQKEERKAVGKSEKCVDKVWRSKKWSWKGLKQCPDMRIAIVAMHGQLRQAWK